MANAKQKDREQLDERLAHALAPTGEQRAPLYNPTTPDGDQPPNLPVGPSPGTPLQAYGPVAAGPEGTNDVERDDHVPAGLDVQAREEHAIESSKAGTEAPSGDDQADERDYSGLEPALPPKD